MGESAHSGTNGNTKNRSRETLKTKNPHSTFDRPHQRRLPRGRGRVSPPAREQDVSNFRTPGHGPESARLTTARGHRPARREIKSELRGQRPPGSRRGAARSQIPSAIICRRCRSGVAGANGKHKLAGVPNTRDCFRNEDFVLSGAKVHAFQPLAGATRLLRCCRSPRSGHGSCSPLSRRTMQPSRSPTRAVACREQRGDALENRACTPMPRGARLRFSLATFPPLVQRISSWLVAPLRDSSSSAGGTPNPR